MDPKAYEEMASTESQHWWFAARREILSRIIGSLKLSSSARILEVGSGTGGNLMMLADHGKVSAVEMDERACQLAVDKADGRVNIVQGSFPDDVPFSGERFDLICMFDVLEHIDKDVETLIVLRQLLAAGGRMLITVPAYGWMWSAHDVFLHHKRRYTSKSLKKAFADAGLQVDRVSYFNTLLLPLAAMVRLKDRIFSRSRSTGAAIPPDFLNRMLFFIFCSEKRLLGKFNLPAGVSLLGVVRSGVAQRDQESR